MTIPEIIWLFIAFLIGGIPFGYLLVAVKDKSDIRSFGSGNIGATNVSRKLGFWWGVLVFTFDFLKGVIPVSVALFVFDSTDMYVYLLAWITVCGHIFSPYLGFRGGKGVATAGGALSLIFPLGIAVSAALLFSVIKVTKTMSLGSFTALGCMLVWSRWRGDTHSFFFVSMLTFLLIWTHRSNLQRLWKNSELTVRRQ